MQRERAFSADGQWLAWGLVLGLLAGAGMALWSSPRSGASFRGWLRRGAEQAAEGAKAKIDAAVPHDVIAQSLAEGKEAARRRREGADL